MGCLLSVDPVIIDFASRLFPFLDVLLLVVPCLIPARNPGRSSESRPEFLAGMSSGTNMAFVRIIGDHHNRRNRTILNQTR
jgi:hypothetical protein